MRGKDPASSYPWQVISFQVSGFKFAVQHMLLPEQIGEIKRLIFRHQPFNIQVDKIFRLFFIKTEPAKIEDAFGRMALFAGHTDVLFGNVPVKVL